MNYIEQINNFWAYTEQEDISAVDIAVYFAILKYCNSLSWLNPFICHWEIICQTSKVSKNAYYKSLERLENIGLIKYEKGEKNTLKKPKVFILQLKNKKGIIEEQKGNKEGIEREQNGEQKGNLYKQVNLETNKPINNTIDYIFEEDKFLTHWNRWKDYKSKEHKFRFKTSISEQASITELYNLSNGDLQNAIKIIDKSIASGWKGFFKLNDGYQKENKPKTPNNLKLGDLTLSCPII